MEQPLVSVVTPVYNNGRYIGRSIESLLAQTYANWELVVVDDGSTDNTAEVVRSYQDPRITYTHQENKGVGALAETINSGVRKTTGELVAMLPSDDLWTPYRLEKQVPVFQDPGVVLCFGRGHIIDQNDMVVGEYKAPRDLGRAQNQPVGAALAYLLTWNYIPQISVLIPRAALDKIGGYLQPPGLLAEDYPTYLALALLGEFRYIDLPLGSYRMHAGQATQNYYFEMIQKDMQYVSEFFHGLDPLMQNRSGWTEASLARELTRHSNHAYFGEGRRNLADGNRSGALRNFLFALRRGAFRTKASAVVGLSCLALGLDLERVAKILGRTPLR